MAPGEQARKPGDVSKSSLVGGFNLDKYESVGLNHPQVRVENKHI